MFYTGDVLDKDVWAVWPDDFMCPKEEVEEYAYRGDDYLWVEVLEYDETGYPSLWVFI